MIDRLLKNNYSNKEWNFIYLNCKLKFNVINLKRQAK
jgi:hypothetical protein